LLRPVDPLDVAEFVGATQALPSCTLHQTRKGGPMTPVTIAQLRTTATIDLMTAARALGLGRTKAYELARREQFLCCVIRIGDTYRVPTAGLLELLGVTVEEPGSPTAVSAQI
jgi:hypothetical protein